VEPWDPQDYARANADWNRYARGGAESGPVMRARPPVPGARWVTPEEGISDAPAHFHWMMSQGEQARNTFFNAVNMYSIFTDIYPTVEAARRQFGGELTSREKQMELARQMANNFRLLLQQSRSGSTLTDAEQALYRKMLPDASEGVCHMCDSNHNASNNFATMYG